MIEKDQLIPRLLNEFPEFKLRWNIHARLWSGEEAGCYIDMSEFVHFVLDNLYENSKFDRVDHAFEVVEDLLRHGNQEAQDVVVLGFLETLQTAASEKPYGNAPFVGHLRPLSRKAWDDLNASWRATLAS